jgi:S-adenosylmethionine-dependent methyltransferase
VAVNRSSSQTHATPTGGRGSGGLLGHARAGLTGGPAERAAGGAAPRTAVVWQVLREELARRGGERLSVVDVGGGTGGFAVPLAAAGHDVTVIDASPDALAALTRRAAEAGVADRVRARQGDADDLAELVPAGTADLVLCHSLLEVVDAPAEVAAALAATLRPGGAGSVLVANRAAAVLHRALGGHLTTATTLLTTDPTPTTPTGQAPTADQAATGQAAGGRGGGARDVVLRRYDAESVTALLAGAGLAVETLHGVRVVADLVPGALLETEPGSVEALVAFELATADKPPYRDIATQLHAFARKHTQPVQPT